jgi:hypothetical protein
MRAAFPDFHAEIHWQLADDDRVTTYKTYHGTYEGPFLGIAPTHRKIHFESELRVVRCCTSDWPWAGDGLCSPNQGFAELDTKS